jgi:hypothetical protein
MLSLQYHQIDIPMVNISLKIEESIFSTAQNILSNTKKSRNSYFNEAIDYYNQVKKREMIAKQLEQESILVRLSSMEVLQEMENLENDYDY